MVKEILSVGINVAFPVVDVGRLLYILPCSINPHTVEIVLRLRKMPKRQRLRDTLRTQRLDNPVALPVSSSTLGDEEGIR
jgi:hypothetical protein